MASIIDLSEELTNQKVDHLPPSGTQQQSHCQKGFYYRGNLFSSPVKNMCQLTQSATNLNESGLDVERINYVRTQSNEETFSDQKSTKPPHLPLRPRRIQSAKAVLQTHSVTSNTDNGVSVVNMNMKTEIPSAPAVLKRKRPRSAIILPSQRHVSWEKSVSRPSTPQSAFVQKLGSRPSSAQKGFTGVDKQCSYIDTTVKPSVYGLKLKRQIYGSDPNIFDSCQTLSDAHPYVKTSVLPTEQSGQKENESKRSIPACLELLRPWLTTSISADLLCLDPSSCLVFLPSLDTDFEDLPIVPLPQSPDDELIERGSLPPKPIVFKKYSHPYINKTLKEICCHAKTRNRICAFDGTIIHQRYQGVRTSNIIRKEILELENLMKGIGSHDSDCMMVQYQADITQLKQMVDETLAKVPDRLKNIPQPTDSFGIHKFCQEHEIIMKQIQEEHDACIVELTLLEDEINIDEDLRHFCKQKLHIHVPVATEILE